MISSEQFKKAVGLINNAKNVLLTSHVRPDGDACGSVAAMCDILSSLGKKVNPIFLSPLAGWYEFLFTEEGDHEGRPYKNGQDAHVTEGQTHRSAPTNTGRDAHATKGQENPSLTFGAPLFE